MNVREIIEKYLKDNGFEGLTGEYCGCELSDLMPCGGTNFPDLCQPGYKIPCPGKGKCELGGCCEFHISTEKPEVEEKK